MVSAWGWEVVLRITGVQKTKKEMAKILPVDGADTCGEDKGGQYKIRDKRRKTKKHASGHGLRPLPYRPGDKKQLKAQDVTAKLVRFNILRKVPKNILFCIKLT